MSNVVKINRCKEFEVDIGEGYRLLGDAEIIQIGDLLLKPPYDRAWGEVQSFWQCMGTIAGKWTGDLFKRPIPKIADVVNFVDPSAVVPPGAKVWHFAVVQKDVILGYGASIGSGAEIGRGSVIGEGSRIGAHVFLPPGSMIGREVFIGPGTVFTDDRHPRANNLGYARQPPVVEDGASIGAGCVILPGVKIGKNAVVGAGTVVRHYVAEGMTVINKLEDEGWRQVLGFPSY